MTPLGGGIRGSNTATMTSMATIPQKELRNNVGEVLRRAEAGEEITITVSGRPVASLGPARTRQWVKAPELADLWAVPADPTLEKDLEAFQRRAERPLGGVARWRGGGSARYLSADCR